MRMFVIYPLFLRCKEGYQGVRCDQFLPKTDSILSDPSTSNVFFLIFSIHAGGCSCHVGWPFACSQPLRAVVGRIKKKHTSSSLCSCKTRAAPAGQSISESWWFGMMLSLLRAKMFVFLCFWLNGKWNCVIWKETQRRAQSGSFKRK